MATRGKPIVAITMAEASGIGPEILMKTINERSIFDHCRPLLIGDQKIMKMVRDEFGIAGKIRVVKTVDDAVWESDTAARPTRIGMSQGSNACARRERTERLGEPGPGGYFPMGRSS